MKLFFCYIHIAGKLTPELRTFTTVEEADLPDLIWAELPEWPPLHRIERIEVCTDENEVIAIINPNADVQPTQ